MKTYKIIICLLALVALSACKDETDNNVVGKPGYLTFDLSDERGWADASTRAGVEAPIEMECTLEGMPLYLHTKVTPTKPVAQEQTPATRGVRYTGDVFALSSNGTPKISDFGVYGRTQDGSLTIFDFTKITPTTTDTKDASVYYDWNVKEDETMYQSWASGPADFYGYAPYFDKVNNENGLSMTLDNGVPILRYAVPTDVEKQLDILTAKHIDATKSSATVVKLPFTHVMSAIKFKFAHGKGTSDKGATWTDKDSYVWSDGVNTYNIIVNTVHINNVYSKGTWTVGDDPYASSNPGRWTIDSEDAGTASFTYSPSKILQGETGAEVELNPDSEGNVFMMLPQTVPSDATISLDCTLTNTSNSSDTKTATLTATLKTWENGSKTQTPMTWLPGYTYTYTISMSDIEYVFDFDTAQDYNATTPSANASATDPLNYTNVSYYGYDSYPLMIRSYKLDSKNVKEEVSWTVKHEIKEVDGDPESQTGTVIKPKEIAGLPVWIKLFEAPNDVKGTEVTSARHTGAKNNSPDRQFRLEIRTIEEPVIDLSLYNYDQTAKWASRNTANCYIVAAPGTYRIPLVYGNAISKGVDKKETYWTKEAIANPNIQQDPSSNYLHKLVNHSGDHISSPYINEVVGNSSIVKNSGEGHLVWEEVDGLIKDVQLDFTDYDDYPGAAQGYLQFTIDPEKFNYGNAVVGVRPQNSTDYYWSWHIWITDPKDFLKTTEVDIKDTHKVKFAGQNVGWVSAQSTQEAKKRNSKVKFVQDETQRELELDVEQLRSNAFTPYLTNTLYQWGRKDPMKGIDSNSHDGQDTGTPRYNESPAYANAAGTQPTVATMIQHPNTIYGVSRGDLYSKSYTNLWGTNCNKKKLTYTYYGKTIYDPCPVGFCVPPSKSFSKLNKRYRTARTGLFAREERSGFVELSGNQPSPVMCEYKLAGDAGSVYFPVAGIRSYDGIYSLTASGYYGGSHATAYYQSASPYSEDENWGMRLDVYTGTLLADTHVGNYKPDHNSAGAVRPVVYYGETQDEESLDPYLEEPLTFTATSNGSIKWTGNVLLDNRKSLIYSHYSSDGSTDGAPTTLSYGSTINVSTGDVVQFYVNMDDDDDDVDITYAGSSYLYHHNFELTGTFEVSGNIMSLISEDYETLTTIYNDYTFNGLFKNCGSHLTSVENLRMPATTLQKGCYYQMFYGCTAITRAPELPAETLATYCYHEMFRGCSSLNYIKALFTSDLRETESTYKKYTNNWVNSVSGTGTFVRNPNIPQANLSIGTAHGVPSGWTVSPSY